MRLALTESSLTSHHVALLTAAAATLLLVAKEILLRRWIKQTLCTPPHRLSDRPACLTKMSGNQTRGTESNSASHHPG
jgi:hypothetical protein